MVLASSWVVSVGIRWFQLVLDRFKWFQAVLVLVSTERLNLDLDLMCCLISFCTKFFLIILILNH